MQGNDHVKRQDNREKKTDQEFSQCHLAGSGCDDNSVGASDSPTDQIEPRQVPAVSRYALEEIAERYSRSASSFLAAVLGGALGSTVGLALNNVTGCLLGLTIGAAAGVLAFRGRNSWRLEKATQKTKEALDLLRAEIGGLPPDAPSEVRDQLYRKYAELMNEYVRVAQGSIDDVRLH